LVRADTEPYEKAKTEKDQIVKSRIGQSAFKKALLVFEKKCRLCGVTDERFSTKVFLNVNEAIRLEINEVQKEYLKWYRVNLFEVRKDKTIY